MVSGFVGTRFLIFLFLGIGPFGFNFDSPFSKNCFFIFLWLSALICPFGRIKIPG